jgi:8-oxo-dGTP pyrophosphatase MutT (NUDIX family)
VALQHTLQKWRDRLTLHHGASAVTRQFGAIPYTIANGRAVFLIVTSRRTGRWIFPKGGAIEGMTPWEVAAHEAYEEAGIEGEVETTPIGTYRDVKSVGMRRTSIEVVLYPLRLVRQLETWPEQRDRHRYWAILPEARRLLANTRLSELAVALDRRIAGEGRPPSEAP